MDMCFFVRSDTTEEVHISALGGIYLKKKKILFKTSLKRTLEYIQAKFHWIIFHKRRGNSK